MARTASRMGAKPTWKSRIGTISHWHYNRDHLDLQEISNRIYTLDFPLCVFINAGATQTQTAHLRATSLSDGRSRFHKNRSPT